MSGPVENDDGPIHALALSLGMLSAAYLAWAVWTMDDGLALRIFAASQAASCGLQFGLWLDKKLAGAA